MVKQTSTVVHRGHETNRLELTCVDRTISASVNGVPVASVQDGAYRTGHLWLGAGVLDARLLPVEARFRNLIVHQR